MSTFCWALTRAYPIAQYIMNTMSKKNANVMELNSIVYILLTVD